MPYPQYFRENTHLSVNINRVGGRSINFQFRFAILSDLSDERNRGP